MRPDKYILNDKHEIVAEEDLMKWAKWFETANRTVAKTEIGIPYWKFLLGKIFHIKRLEPARISTVFLGLDHNLSGEGLPLLFETMVFGGLLDKEMERYSTWEKAEIGHKQWVSKVKAVFKEK